MKKLLFLAILLIAGALLGNKVLGLTKTVKAWDHQYWNYTWSEWSECVVNEACKPEEAGFVNGTQTRTQTATCLLQTQYNYPPNCEIIDETKIVDTETQACRVEVPMCVPETTPAPTVSPDICANIDGIQTSVPEGQHLDASGLNCVNFELGGAPAPAEVTSKPEVLGASTMAGTGLAEENMFNLVFVLGSLLSAFGIRKFFRVTEK